MRILLCGEGQHEFGDDDAWDSRRQRSYSFEGWMQTLVTRLTTHETEYEFRRRSDIFADLGVGTGRVAKLKGHGEKAKIARFIAQQGEFDAVIFMADADDTDRAVWRRIRSEIEAGFAAVPDGPPAIACVPMSASESWLMTDSAVWRAQGLLDPTILPRRPETTWGARRDPDANHPHQIFRRLCQAADTTDSTKTRVEIASAAALAGLRTGCPISFPPFADKVAAL